MNETLQIKGLGDILAKLKTMDAEVQAHARRGVRMLGELIMTEAKQRTPFKEGILTASGYVKSRDDGNVEVGFGGEAGAYAVRQHEELTWKHERGQPKFLESVIDEVRPNAAAIVAEQAKKAVGG